MPEADPSNDPAAAAITTKACSICGEPVQLTARKCIHCDSYLDWRRWIGLSQLTLALIIALISVITTGVPIIKEEFQVSDSQLHAIFVAQNPQFAENNVDLLVTNDGTKTGVVIDAVLLPSGISGPQISLQPATQRNPIFVGPKVAQPVRMRFDTSKGDVPDVQAALSHAMPLIISGECQLQVHVINASSTKQSLLVRAPCLGFYGVLTRAAAEGYFGYYK